MKFDFTIHSTNQLKIKSRKRLRNPKEHKVFRLKTLVQQGKAHLTRQNVVVFETVTKLSTLSDKKKYSMFIINLKIGAESLYFCVH